MIFYSLVTYKKNSSESVDGPSPAVSDAAEAVFSLFEVLSLLAKSCRASGINNFFF